MKFAKASSDFREHLPITEDLNGLKPTYVPKGKKKMKIANNLKNLVRSFSEKFKKLTCDVDYGLES